MSYQLAPSVYDRFYSAKCLRYTLGWAGWYRSSFLAGGASVAFLQPIAGELVAGEECDGRSRDRG